MFLVKTRRVKLAARSSTRFITMSSPSSTTTYSKNIFHKNKIFISNKKARRSAKAVSLKIFIYDLLATSIFFTNKANITAENMHIAWYSTAVIRLSVEDSSQFIIAINTRIKTGNAQNVR